MKVRLNRQLIYFEKKHYFNKCIKLDIFFHDTVQINSPIVFWKWIVTAIETFVKLSSSASPFDEIFVP